MQGDQSIKTEKDAVGQGDHPIKTGKDAAEQGDQSIKKGKMLLSGALTR